MTRNQLNAILENLRGTYVHSGVLLDQLEREPLTLDNLRSTTVVGVNMIVTQTLIAALEAAEIHTTNPGDLN